MRKCIKEHKPVFITKNGAGHLVFMTQQPFVEQQALLVDEAEDHSRAEKRRPFREAMADLRGRIHEKASNITKAAEHDLAKIIDCIAILLPRLN